MTFIKPTILISKCLEFEACRYDGKIINNKNIKKLIKHIIFKPVCPEIEIGMGIPRNTIRIIENQKKQLLLQSQTGRDYSKKINVFSEKFLSRLNYIDGFILKSNSPSCGVKSAKIYSKKNNLILKKNSSGFFSKQILSMFPNHPIQEEDKLNNVFIREHFYTSIFTIADFKRVNNINELYKYHSKHKYLFMSYNQTILKKLGNIAANLDDLPSNKVIDCYYKNLLKIFLKKARYTSNINTQMHIMGYFKKMLTTNEKKHFLDTIEKYRDKKIPTSYVNRILVSWVNRFENKYLKNQSYFQPFPNDLTYST
tara:strand:- start:29 stop:961 length:933 start_codon:yes stop_codon:yes gene_type:complete